MGMSSNEFATPWLALTPSNRESGCMSMIPGSHKNQIYEHVDTYGEENILTRGQEVVGVNPADAIDVVLRPGQMSIHHGQIVHASQANCSAHRRIGFAMQSYMPPHIMQVIGKNYWLDIQGKNARGPNSVSLNRPIGDASPESVALREEVDANLASILYKDAAEQRRY